MIEYIEPAEPCRYCKLPTYHRDEDGPLHDCCEMHKEDILKGVSAGAISPCPACEVSRKISRKVTDFDIIRRDPSFGGEGYIPVGTVLSTGPWITEEQAIEWQHNHGG
jgi:hypothetical protein